jgi:putative FmdB family regulatory protein
MPLYEYQCDCGSQFEALRSIAMRKTVICPKCGNLAFKKLSVANHTFGWDVDYGERFSHEKLVRNI